MRIRRPVTSGVVLVILASLLAGTASAQSSSGVLLGIQVVCTTGGCALVFGSIDPGTASITAANAVLNFAGFPEAFDCVHGSAFDAGNRHYFLVFRDAQGPHLAELDAHTGSVLNGTNPANISTAPLIPFPLRDLQFDAAAGVLLGIQSTAGGFSLGVIDPNTGAITAISNFVGTPEVSDCHYASALDATNHRYYFVYNNAGPRLAVVDTQTSVVTQDIAIPLPLNDLQFDSTTGALIGIQDGSPTLTVGTVDIPTGTIPVSNTILSLQAGIEIFDGDFASTIDSSNHHYYFVYRDTAGDHLAEVNTQTTGAQALILNSSLSLPTYDLQFSPVTFHAALLDIANLQQQGLINNAGVANALVSKIQAAESAAAAGNSQAARNILQAFQNQVTAQTGNHISAAAAQVLQQDAAALISQLP